jgi:hypothetical protein
LVVALLVLVGIGLAGCGGSSTSAGTSSTGSSSAPTKFREQVFSDYTPSEQKVYVRAFHACEKMEKAYDYTAIGNYLKEKASLNSDVGAAEVAGCSDGSAEPQTPLKGSGLP